MSTSTMTPKPDHGTRGASQLSAYSDTGSRSSTALPMMPGTGSGQSPYPISVTPKPSPSPQPNLFDSILKELASQRPPFRAPDAEPSPPPTPEPLPPKQTCSPRDYLEKYVFPVLLPALEAMLHGAKDEKCFERKRTKFNALDFLTEYLWTHNAQYADRIGTELGDIPFVKEHWEKHPRAPLPKSLLWNEKQASSIIQNFWRGYKVRKEPDVQELRQWQQEWRAENGNIYAMVDHFWDNQMPEEERSARDHTPRSNSPATARLNQGESNTTQSDTSTTLSYAVP